jgi:propanol-preferring alcohol dehydrogenase
MKAARLHGYGERLALDDIPMPHPGPGEVVIKVGGAGFCHSDLHVIDGEIRVLPRMPLVLGHENAGIVAEAGAGVTGVREGDAVAVFGGWGCGHCDYCVTGHDQLCVTPQWAGLSNYDGGYAEYLLVPHARYLVKLSTLTPAQAAPLTDAALTPYRAIRKALPFLEPDHPALLIGLGGLGQYGLRLLRLFSAGPVIVVDTSPAKREMAIGLGAAHALDGHATDLRQQLADLTHAQGVSASFDFVGTAGTLDLAVASTRSLGKVSQIGLAGGAARMKVLENTRFEVLFEATLWGTVKELREVVALAESGALPLIPLELQPLERINDVYDRLKRGEVAGRIVVTPNG